jgi:hypothetical protein
MMMRDCSHTKSLLPHSSECACSNRSVPGYGNFVSRDALIVEEDFADMFSGDLRWSSCLDTDQRNLYVLMMMNLGRGRAQGAQPSQPTWYFMLKLPWGHHNAAENYHGRSRADVVNGNLGTLELCMTYSIRES